MQNRLFQGQHIYVEILCQRASYLSEYAIRLYWRAMRFSHMLTLHTHIVC